MKINKRFYYILGVVIILFFVFTIIKIATLDRHKLVENELQSNEYDIVIGSENAVNTVFMYSSYSCVYCCKFFLETFPKIDSLYIKTGKLKLVIKLIDLTNSVQIHNSLKIAVCLNEFGNFEYLNKLLLQEPTVIYTTEFNLVIEDLINNDLELAQCMLSDKADQYLKLNKREFIILELTGTPTFVINKSVYKGFKNFYEFNEILEKELPRVMQ